MATSTGTDAEIAEATGTVNRAYPGPVVGWYAVIVLLLLYTSSFIDRTIIALLVAPIRKDLDISDTQISLLQGFAFAIFYTLMGLPLGRLADQRSRRAIIGWGAALWSVMTALCGLAGNFWQLFLARVGVGVGEATLSPAAYSLITDTFPKERLARALSVYNLGISLGAGCAFLIGGTVIKLVSAEGAAVPMPVLGALAPWQAAFVTVGLPGVLLALLMLTVPEPSRKGLLGTGQRLSVGETLAFVRRHASTYGFLIGGGVSYGIVTFGFQAWVPASLGRTFGWGPGEVGVRLGLLFLVFGTLGLVAAGWIADRLVSRGKADGHYRTALGIGVVMIPFVIAAPLATNPTLALVLFAGAIATCSAWTGVVAASLQTVTPNQMRGQVAAFYIFCGSMLSFGLGPTLIALITDQVFGFDAAVRYSLAIVGGVTAPLGVVLFALGLKPYRRFQEAARAWTGGGT